MHTRPGNRRKRRSWREILASRRPALGVFRHHLVLLGDRLELHLDVLDLAPLGQLAGAARLFPVVRGGALGVLHGFYRGGG
jgi:hypothetical protein